MSSENSKPEWFQMADADVTPPRTKSKRVIRIMALATPLLVLGAGLVFAQTQGSPTAVASAAATTAALTAATPATSSATAPAAPIATPAQVSTTVSPAAPAVTTQNVAMTIKKPAIATLPTGGGEGDGLRTSDDE